MHTHNLKSCEDTRWHHAFPSAVPQPQLYYKWTSDLNPKPNVNQQLFEFVRTAQKVLKVQKQP